MKQIVGKLILAGSVALCLADIGAALAGDLTPAAKDEQVMNAHREMRILTSFNTNPRLHAYDLTVIVDGNTAAIGGAVENDLARDLAAQLALGEDGIEHLDNRIHVDARVVPPERGPTGGGFKGG